MILTRTIPAARRRSRQYWVLGCLPPLGVLVLVLQAELGDQYKLYLLENQEARPVSGSCSGSDRIRSSDARQCICLDCVVPRGSSQNTYLYGCMHA